MMRVRNEPGAHIFVALQTGSVGIHFRFQLPSARPRFRIGLAGNPFVQDDLARLVELRSVERDRERRDGKQCHADLNRSCPSCR